MFGQANALSLTTMYRWRSCQCCQEVSGVDLLIFLLAATQTRNHTRIIEAHAQVLAIDGCQRIVPAIWSGFRQELIRSFELECYLFDMNGKQLSALWSCELTIACNVCVSSAMQSRLPDKKTACWSGDTQIGLSQLPNVSHLHNCHGAHQRQPWSANAHSPW